MVKSQKPIIGVKVSSVSKNNKNGKKQPKVGKI